MRSTTLSWLDLMARESRHCVSLRIRQPANGLKTSVVHVTDRPMQIALRPAGAQDFEYCKRLYFAGMKTIIAELNLDMAAQAVSFSEQWALEQVRIIDVDDSNAGWLQSEMRDDEMFIAQLFVDGPFQRQGIGTHVMKSLIGEAARLNQPVRLAVVKINPALRLYERLGFHTTHEDDRKFYMKRDPDGAGPA
jgi:ribosomal protein S18 acetylase RimI-like enzyme